MKRLLLVAAASLLFVACMAQGKPSTYVEVLYFHGKQRCLTCRAMEKYAKEAVYKDMAKFAKSGKVRFREVDISTPDGGKLADKYRVSWSSLYVNRWKDGKENRNDMTRFGFQYARKDPGKFKKGLVQKIKQLIK